MNVQELTHAARAAEWQERIREDRGTYHLSYPRTPVRSVSRFFFYLFVYKNGALPAPL